MNYKTLENLLDQVFENPEIKDINIVFSPAIEVSKEEFEQIIQNADPLQAVNNNGLILSEYEWWEEDKRYLKLQIEYFKQNDKIYLKRLYFWREERK